MDEDDLDEALDRLVALTSSPGDVFVEIYDERPLTDADVEAVVANPGARVIVDGPFVDDLHDLSWLRPLAPVCESLAILHHEPLDLTELTDFRRLRHLRLGAPVDRAVDLSGLPITWLELELDWQPELSSLLAIPTVSRVSAGIGPDDLGRARWIPEYVAIGHRDLVTFDVGLDLSRLRRAEVRGARVHSLLWTHLAPSLEVLSLSGCRRIEGLELLGSLPRLRQLFFQDCKRAYDPRDLDGLDHVEVISFDGMR